MPARSGDVAWAAYRRMRWAWWTLTAALIAAFLFDSSVELRFALAVFWGALSAAAAYWPCPHCGKRVGVGGRFVVVVSPFGGGCLACHRRLFATRPPHDG